MSHFTRIYIDADTVAALQRGDRAAAGDVYRALADVVYTLALRVLADPQLAKEVTQDTFVDMIERAHTLLVPAAFVGWVRSLAINRCLMRLRSPWHRLRSAMVEVDVADGASDAARLDGFGDIERGLARLSPQTRFVVWMYDVEGYTHAEIAQLMGRTESFSKSQLARGHARLLAWQMERSDETTTDTENAGRCVAGASGGGAAG